MRRRTRYVFGVAAVLAVAVLAAGCASSRLQREAFEGRRIAATAAFPPKPVVYDQFLASVGVYPHAPAGRPASGRAGGEQDQVERLQGLLNAAAERVDLADHVARAALTAGTDRLGATVARTPDEADYVLDVRVYDYGLVMRSYNTEANFFVRAEMLMRDRATDEVVWKTRLDRAGTYHTRLTGAEMAHLDEAAMARELERFAVLTAERLTDALLNDVRDG